MRILIIGLGSIAKKHIAAIFSVDPDAEIFALRSSESGDQYPGVINLYTLEVLKYEPDFVIISNPTFLHGEAISQLLDRGWNCPLFIEKPVFGSLENVADITKIISERNLITYVACNMRFHPALFFLKKYLADKNPVINEVNIYCGSYLPSWRPGSDFRKSYSANSEMGGGVHLDLIHELDYCTWLFGMPLKTNVTKRTASELEINAVDFASYTLQYKQFTANIILNYYRRDPKREIEMVMANDTLQVDLLRNTIISKITGTTVFTEAFEMRQTYEAQIRYFLDAISQQHQPMNNILEGVEVLKIALYE